ncbi:MAG: hypothetical protein Q8O91_02040, partial [Candidatus Aminicenantes bacterium]|nr:hypothetical protein [Candidatus Aminicenantes bacterium]
GARGGTRGRSSLPAEILTPTSFGFFGGEYLARISNSINMIFADVAGMCLPEELRSGILAGRKTRLPEKTETQRRDFLMVASPSSPSSKLIISALLNASSVAGVRGLALETRQRPNANSEGINLLSF